MSEQLKQKLLEQPGVILAQELGFIEMSQKQADDRRVSEEIKTLARNEAAMNLNFKNEGQRNASVETALRDNVLYQEIQKRVPEQDKQIRIAQVQLSYQKDLLKSYLTIAGTE